MKNPNIKVGQKIWLKEISWATIRQEAGKPLTEDVIEKIGIKYFTTKKGLKFRIDTLKHDAGNYSSRYVVYLDPKVYYDKAEVMDKISEIRDAIGKVTEIEKIREIHRILFGEIEYCLGESETKKP